MSPVWKAPLWLWTQRRGWRWFGMRFSSPTRRSSRHKRYGCVAHCSLCQRRWFAFICHKPIRLKFNSDQLPVNNQHSWSLFRFRRRSRRCLRTWCRSSTQTLSSSTNTGSTWRRLRPGWEYTAHIYIYFQACRLSLTATDTFAASLASSSSTSFLRSYLSPSTCHRGALSSSWRKPRRTTRPWTSRSVTVVHLHKALQQQRWSHPHLPKGLWVM